MKKIFLSSFLTSLLFSFSISAQPGKEIKIDANFFTGIHFFQGGLSISANKAAEIIKSNSAAYEMLRSSTKQAGGATVIGAIGGALIGWQIGAVVSDGKPAWEWVAVGAGITVTSALIYKSAENKAKTAVELYNSGLRTTSCQKPSTEIRLIAAPSQLGLSISF